MEASLLIIMGKRTLEGTARIENIFVSARPLVSYSHTRNRINKPNFPTTTA